MEEAGAKSESEVEEIKESEVVIYIKNEIEIIERPIKSESISDPIESEYAEELEPIIISEPDPELTWEAMPEVEKEVVEYEPEVEPIPEPKKEDLKLDIKKDWSPPRSYNKKSKK